MLSGVSDKGLLCKIAGSPILRSWPTGLVSSDLAVEVSSLPKWGGQVGSVSGLECLFPSITAVQCCSDGDTLPLDIHTCKEQSFEWQP